MNERDKHGRFVFYPLASPQGQKWLERMGLPLETRDTMVLIEGERYYLRSTAVLRMVRRVCYPWPLLYAFIVVPRPLRDWTYRVVERNRPRIPIGRNRSGANRSLPVKDRHDE